MSLGIALGGGGARGLAHIGVLEVLEAHGIRPRYVAGTSIGAVVGALYCLQGSAQGLREKARQMISSDEFRDLKLDKFYTRSDNIITRFRHDLFEKFFLGSLFFKRSHLKHDATRRIFTDMLGQKTFDDCAAGFVCNALDIQSGEEVVFRHGPLAGAVWASCAIPGIFPPCAQGERLLVDGGVIDNIPIKPARSIGAASVLAVYLNKRPAFSGGPSTGYHINQRSFAFMRYHLDQSALAGADLILEPEVSEFHWADFNSIDVLAELGREAANRKIGAIKAISRYRYRFVKIFKRRIS
ncbi:patatin-like phospholipase family protein [candidate division WOR-3 bacterium]|nr:patatin-like phospholipase family protein [candidate division WOR-3 bacterium]